ncbi:MAG: zinc-binding dehydrogenase, partial [candidate division Zixibacteria bacterium]|nr:zinc-binding dehydrogenase [candidate division Zixibacteria bacterium]
MKQVLVRGGNIVIEQVPAPIARESAVVVRTSYSIISSGTELSAVESSSDTVFDRIRKKPELIRKGIASVREHGLLQTYRTAKGDEGLGQALGYSLSGVVTAVGSGIADLSVGDPVACAGAGLANHAEQVCVPRNLIVTIPDGVAMNDAASVTLGAIAMQGIRQAAPLLGEWVVVTGLGLLGLLTVQMLRANGCRVVGIDPDENRRRLASELGADFCYAPSEEQL